MGVLWMKPLVTHLGNEFHNITLSGTIEVLVCSLLHYSNKPISLAASRFWS